MKKTPIITLQNVWNDASVHDEVISLWQEQHILPQGIDGQERAKQLVLVAKHEDRIVGVTTAHRRPAKLINNKPMFAFRIFIHPEFRLPGLSTKMTVETRDILQKLHKEGKTDCIGIIAVFENKGLIHRYHQAVLPASKLTFVGNTADGKPVRVYYFPGVLI